MGLQNKKRGFLGACDPVHGQGGNRAREKLPRGTTREVEGKRERERPNGGAPPTRKRSTDVRTEGRRSRDETKETDLHSGWLDGSVDGKLKQTNKDGAQGTPVEKFYP